MASVLVQFRLHPDNPDEARALEVLRAWRGARYPTRAIMTRALLALEAGADGPDIAGLLEALQGAALPAALPDDIAGLLQDIQAQQARLLEAVETLQAGGVGQTADGDQAGQPLNPEFVSAILNAQRGGRRA